MIIPTQLRLDLAQHIRASSWVGIPAAPFADFVCDFLEGYEHPSYSAAVELLNNPKEPSRYNFRRDAPWNLAILKPDVKGPSTMLEIVEYKIAAGCPEKYAKDLTRHIGELRYWGLVRDTGQRRKACIVWELTADGLAFLNGEASVPSHIFVKDRKRVEPTEEYPNGHLIFVNDVPARNPGDEYAKGKYVRKTSKPIAQYAA